MAEPEKSFVTIDRATIETIKQREEGKATKVINLIKSIQKAAEENSNLTCRITASFGRALCGRILATTKRWSSG